MRTGSIGKPSEVPPAPPELSGGAASTTTFRAVANETEVRGCAIDSRGGAFADMTPERQVAGLDPSPKHNNSAARIACARDRETVTQIVGGGAYADRHRTVDFLTTCYGPVSVFITIVCFRRRSRCRLHTRTCACGRQGVFQWGARAASL